MKKKMTYTIGLDLGGTKLAAALLRSDGQIMDFSKIPVELSREGSATKTQKRVIELMTSLVLDLKKRYPKECAPGNFRGVGLACAGPMNAESGELIRPVNFPGWKIVPIRALLEKDLERHDFKTKVAFQNDAIAAALAEGWIGAAKGMKSYAVVTVGTGIGTGVIFQGRPCHTNGMGSEFGHTIVDFKKLKSNPEKLHHCTVEGIASGTGLLRRAKELGFRGASIEELATEQDNKYQILFDEMAWALACICYDLSIGFNLEGIFLSGGLIKIKNLYLPQMKTHYKNMIQQMNPAFLCKIEIARTKNQAGVLGGAYLPYLGLP